ncbi:ABC transporter permease subunit [bacterium]|nr:ABC transporter permease subunit [bacterium]
MIRRIRLVAGTVFTEAIRRREIYVIVIVTVALLVAASWIRFFNLAALHKFYHEIALKVMSIATAVTTVVLAARQLPREFERRTIYTIMAKPLARWEFLLGKWLGVVGAGLFCLALFMAVFAAGTLLAGSSIGWRIFLQFIYMQALSVALLAALAFLLSMLMDIDAAITTALLLYLLGSVLTNAMIIVHDFVGAAGRVLLVILNYVIPQPALFDMSAKVVHEWSPVPAWVLGLSTLYALMFIVPYLSFSYLLFRKRKL